VLIFVVKQTTQSISLVNCLAEIGTLYTIVLSFGLSIATIFV
jgi:hypothetical protein